MKIRVQSLFNVVLAGVVAYTYWLLHTHMVNVMELHYRLQELLEAGGRGGMGL